MSRNLLKALRVGSVVLAVGGGTLVLSQALAAFIVVRVMGSFVQQVLG